MNKVILSLVAGFTLAAGAALAKPFEEGLQYVPVNPQPPVGSGNEVEVVEFFWYGCNHCNDFEPVVSKWAAQLPENVKFVQIPVMFGGPADLHAQVYYALEGIGELDRIHEKLFHVINVEGRKLRSRDEVDAFLEANGVDMDKYREAMTSFSVAAKVNRARALMRRYGIRGVPALVVDARYRSGTGFKSYEEMTEVVDYVVDKVLAQRKAESKK